MQKYRFEDARPVLERASARETARGWRSARCAPFLDQAYGIRLVSHTVAIGTASVAEGTELPLPEDVDRLDADPVRAFDASGSAAMVAEVDAARRTATPWAASSRWSPTASRRAWAPTCTGTGGSTRSWPPP